MPHSYIRDYSDSRHRHHRHHKYRDELSRHEFLDDSYPSYDSAEDRRRRNRRRSPTSHRIRASRSPPSDRAAHRPSNMTPRNSDNRRSIEWKQRRRSTERNRRESPESKLRYNDRSDHKPFIDSPVTPHPPSPPPPSVSLPTSAIPPIRELTQEQRQCIVDRLKLEYRAPKVNLSSVVRVQDQPFTNKDDLNTLILFHRRDVDAPILQFVRFDRISYYSSYRRDR